MITRFRIESEMESKEDAIDSVTLAATKIISEMDRLVHQPDGQWECTQDVVIRSGKNYKARMVMLFHKKEDHAR